MSHHIAHVHIVNAVIPYCHVYVLTVWVDISSLEHIDSNNQNQSVN